MIIHIKGLTRHKHIGRLRTVSNPKETLTPEYGAHSDKQLRKGPCRTSTCARWNKKYQFDQLVFLFVVDLLVCVMVMVMWCIFRVVFVRSEADDRADYNDTN